MDLSLTARAPVKEDLQLVQNANLPLHFGVLSAVSGVLGNGNTGTEN